jgi:hypothetical protein
MKIKVINEQENLHEVMQVLLTHLEPSKVLNCIDSNPPFSHPKTNIYATPEFCIVTVPVL